jgi:hypothetical protein
MWPDATGVPAEKSRQRANLGESRFRLDVAARQPSAADDFLTAVPQF